MYSDSLLQILFSGYLRIRNWKGGPFEMINIIVGAVLVIGILIAIKEIRSKDKK